MARRSISAKIIVIALSSKIAKKKKSWRREKRGHHHISSARVVSHRHRRHDMRDGEISIVKQQQRKRQRHVRSVHRHQRKYSSAGIVAAAAIYSVAKQHRKSVTELAAKAGGNSVSTKNRRAKGCIKTSRRACLLVAYRRHKWRHDARR